MARPCNHRGLAHVALVQDLQRPYAVISCGYCDEFIGFANYKRSRAALLRSYSTGGRLEFHDGALHVFPDPNEELGDWPSRDRIPSTFDDIDD